MKFKRNSINVFIFIFTLCLTVPVKAEEAQQQPPEITKPSPAIEKEAGQEKKEDVNITLEFKEADIKNVMKIISRKASVNIVTSPSVEGSVTMRLANVPWTRALDVITKTYGLGYEWIGDNVILVATLEELAEKREREAQAVQQEPLETMTYKLKYLDAKDVKAVIESQLTPRGKIAVLKIEQKKGWRARGGYGTGGGSGGTSDFEKARREEGVKPKANTLIITDTKSNVRNIIEAIKKIDIKPNQILIEARIMEVNRDSLKDLGLDWGTGGSVTSGTITGQPVDKSKSGDVVSNLGVIGLTSQEAPSVFGPKTSTIASIWPFDTGLSLLYQKLTGTQFQVLLHALEEDVHSNTLSAPRIVTLDGQEAYIMIGEKRPIIKSEIESSQTSVGITKNLNYYQSLGIELNVVPQVVGKNQISMAIYPSVTSSSQNVSATSQIGTATSTDTYPIILVRETQTQILMNDGETIVIGGLLKDVKSEGVFKVPILGDIPILGLLFQRKTTDIEKIDLLIFITAHIVKDEEFTAERISMLKERLKTIDIQKNKKQKKEGLVKE